MGCKSIAVLVFDQLLIIILASANKPRGLQAARKLRNTRRDNRWVRSNLLCLHTSQLIIYICGALFREIRQTNLTKSAPLATFTRHPPQEAPHTQRALSSRRLASRRSSPTLPSASVCVCNSLRMGRKSLLSSPYVVLLVLWRIGRLRSEKITPQNDGCLNFVDENDEVLISGFGRRGKAKGDIPGVRFKVVKVSGVGLLALWKEKKVRVLQSF